MQSMVRATLLAVAAVGLAGCSVFGIRSGYEQPPYEVVSTMEDGIEIRRYGARTAAQVVLDRDDSQANGDSAFGILAGYIFGGNRGEESIDMTSPVAVEEGEEGDGGEEIAMTAPVETSQGAGGRYAMRFFLPAAYSVANAPVPNDPRVEIVEVPATTLAVLRFSGLARDATVAERRRTLLETLDGSNWQAAGTPTALYYDPPWTLPFLRRNEVAVAVTAR